MRRAWYLEQNADTQNNATPERYLLRFTPTPNYAPARTLFNATHEGLTSRIHDEPVLLNILHSANTINLPIRIFASLPRVILTLAPDGKLQYTRATPDNVLYAIKTGWRRDSNHTL